MRPLFSPRRWNPAERGYVSHLMYVRSLALAVGLFALDIGVGSAASVPVPAPSAAPTPVPIVVPSVPVNSIINDVIRDVAGQVTSSFNVDPNRVRGTVTYFHRFDMQVRMQLNTYRNVRLHQGTVINPRGWTLAAGQTVDVLGHADPDGTLEADVITVRQ